MLPAAVKKAEFESKRVERMKRFKSGEEAEEEEEDADRVNADIIESNVESSSNTALMERKLRFGTLSESDKVMQRQQKFGGGNGGKKGFNHHQQRQFKNKQKFRKFREYKKNNKRGRGGYNGSYGGNQFNAEEQQKVNERKARFAGM